MAGELGLRYHRQQLIEDWDQNKLKNARIAVIGTGQTASCAGATLAALGVGNITVLGNERATDKYQFLLEEVGRTDSAAEAIAHRLKLINPLVEVMGINAPLDDVGLMMIEGSNAVVDTTNDTKSKKTCMEFCKANKIQYISSGYRCCSDRRDRIGLRGTPSGFRE